MIKKEVTINNPSGLHARPAASFVAAASKFSSEILIRSLSADKPPVNAKSMVMLLSLGLSKGSRAELTTNGNDEAQAMEALTAFIASGCGETA